MKRLYLVLGLTLIFSSFLFGQGQKQESEVVDPTPKAKKTAKNGGKSNSSSILNAGTRLEAQLQSAVDVRRSKVGDEVVLKTTKSVRQDGEVVVPKGTRLIGRVTEIQRKTKENGTSRIGMVFDRIEGKNLSAPINASIVSVVAAQATATAGDVFAGDASGTSTTSGRASSGGGGSGGLLGGVGSTVGGVVNTTASTVGGVANTAATTVGGATNTLGRTVGGLQVSQSAAGSATGSSTISSQDKNLRMEKGATLQLTVIGSVQN